MGTAPFIIITYSFVCVAHFFQNVVFCVNVCTFLVFCVCQLSNNLCSCRQHSFQICPLSISIDQPGVSSRPQWVHWWERLNRPGSLPVRLIRVPACWSLLVWSGSSLLVPVGPCAFTKSIVALPLGTGVTVTLIIFRLQQIGTYVLTCTSRASFVNPVVPFPPSLPSCQKSYRHRNTLHILSKRREVKGSPWEIFWK